MQDLLSDEFLAKVIKNDGTSSGLALKLSSYRKIQSQLQILIAKRKRILQEYDEKLEECEQEIITIRKQCQHKITTYHNDPSGGSDSSTSCDICGAEL